MGLDMYLLSVPKYKGDIKPTGNDLYWLNCRIDYSHKINPQYSFETYYGTESVQDCPEWGNWLEYYKQFYEAKAWTNGSIFREEAYWRKAYDIAEFLNKFYNNIQDDYLSKPITRVDIQYLKGYAQNFVDKAQKPQKIKIVGYTNQKGDVINLPKTADKLILQPVFADGDNLPKVPIDTEFYTALPLEYLAEDNWELGHAMYTVEVCDKILNNFDFENKWLFYLASY